MIGYVFLGIVWLLFISYWIGYLIWNKKKLETWKNF